MGTSSLDLYRIGSHYRHVFAPFSPTLSIFVLWRIIQAVGTSMVYPNAIALVRYAMPDTVGRFLGWIGMAAGIAIPLGRR